MKLKLGVFLQEQTVQSPYCIYCYETYRLDGIIQHFEDFFATQSEMKSTVLLPNHDLWETDVVHSYFIIIN